MSTTINGLDGSVGVAALQSEDHTEEVDGTVPVAIPSRSSLKLSSSCMVLHLNKPGEEGEGVKADVDVSSSLEDCGLSPAQLDGYLSGALPFFEANQNEDELIGDSVKKCDEKKVAALVEKASAALSSVGVQAERFGEGTQVVDMLNRFVDDGADGSFFVTDLTTVLRKYEQWCRLLPRVTPHYAVKCNPDEAVVRALRAAGAAFDCASANEIELALSAGALPSQIIYANPCKAISGLNHAKKRGVDLMTFDNMAELDKVHKHYREARLVLRMKPTLELAACKFSTKFGASYAASLSLLDRAAVLGLNVVGVSFHVGSGTYSTRPFVQAIEDARRLFDAAAERGFSFTILDIGGGWPGSDEVRDDNPLSFPTIAVEVTPALDRLFPASEGYTIIGEPGRYMVSESTTLATLIIGKRVNDDPDAGEDSHAYYLSDGVYGSFNAIFFDHMMPQPHVLRRAQDKQETGFAEAPSHPATCFGPTCDSIDVVCASAQLPDMEVDDWLFFYNFGAYTRAAASSFNGMPITPTRYYFSA